MLILELKSLSCGLETTWSGSQNLKFWSGYGSWFMVSEKTIYFQHTEDDNYVHHRSVRHLHPWKGFTRIPWL